ncbi:Protein CapL [Saliniradius amylolyticus]|uniref:Protein CapL n=1 Tax=Saliniradius amylolyticus TaxID=2183582 RepID=A0A2S2E3Q1_9ALTE|nr:Vi polysaccharide biosynthesis UDP-N-acetylglucosamine C-6 dehydrogenase TviB [Saliniradius amylolyticus]AWL11647.1 Protein CapL [Saliniradius amylolyticus]
MKQDYVIGVIGLGYVGLPLAVAFGEAYDTLGFDISDSRIQALREGVDATRECSADELAKAEHLNYSSDLADLRRCNFYIVTVPTPVDSSKRPDLSPLINASQMLGEVIGKGDIIVYESTVYPGATEQDCVPVVERVSGLTLNDDFYVGYSPERINPGDNAHKFKDIKKVTSGSTPEVAEIIDSLYASVVRAGTHKAESIMVAEAAKVIENTQRDLNIALINELAIIFNKLGIDTDDVLRAAGTKWNFLPFRPGLVGGHCIGVDPYYLTHKAQAIGYQPQVILAGRRINDDMGKHVVHQLVKRMIKKEIKVFHSRALVLGLAFKEDCPDIRNTRVIDVVHEMEDFDIDVEVYDPLVNKQAAFHEYGIELIDEPTQAGYDVVILAVAHKEFKQLAAQTIRSYGKDVAVVYDLKHALPREMVDLRL